MRPTGAAAREGADAIDTGAPRLELRDLAVHFPVERGETLGLVGESGCGKSTLAKAVLKLLRPTAGSVLVHGEDIWAQDAAATLAHRRRVQAVFQLPTRASAWRAPDRGALRRGASGTLRAAATPRFMQAYAAGR